MRSTWLGMAVTQQGPWCMKFAWSAETIDTLLSIRKRQFTS